MAALLLSSASATAAPTAAASLVHAHTYDVVWHAAIPLHEVTERGPPTSDDHPVSFAAVDRESQLVLTRSGTTTSPATYTYDHSAPLARDAQGTVTTPDPLRQSDGAISEPESGGVAAKGAGEAGALVRYDAQAASRNLLGQVGEGYARTPSGYTVSAHAAERIVYGAPGRSPTTLGRVDDILNSPTRSVMRPDGSIRVFQGKDWVAVRGSGPIHIITVMVR